MKSCLLLSLYEKPPGNSLEIVAVNTPRPLLVSVQRQYQART